SLGGARGREGFSGAGKLALLPPARGFRRAARRAARVGQERAGGFRRGATGRRGPAPARRHDGRAAVRAGARQSVSRLVRRAGAAPALHGARAARPDRGLRPACARQRGPEALLFRDGHVVSPAHRRAMRGGRNSQALTTEYLDSLQHQRRLSPATLTNYRRALAALLDLAGSKSLDALEAAEGRRHVALLHGKGLAPRSLALILSAWRGCFRWLARHRGFTSNPVLGIRAPKAARPLPKALTVEAAQRLLDSDEGEGPLLVQDRAMFELLYSSGLRVGELVALDLADDPAQGEVTVTGKGSKTRTVPVGLKAREALKRWLVARCGIASSDEK